MRHRIFSDFHTSLVKGDPSDDAGWSKLNKKFSAVADVNANFY